MTANSVVNGPINGTIFQSVRVCTLQSFNVFPFLLVHTSCFIERLVLTAVHIPLITLYSSVRQVSSSPGCLGWATLFYCGTHRAFHILVDIRTYRTRYLQVLNDKIKTTEKMWRHRLPHFQSMGIFCRHSLPYN